MDPASFAQRLHDFPAAKTTLDRALALLWLAGREDPSRGCTAKEIAGALEAGGYPGQNASRLHKQLVADPRTAKAGQLGFRLRPAARVALEVTFAQILGPRRAKSSDSLIPRELVENTRRDYLKRVVHQANAAYDAELFDCSSVMLRRLVETLIIEVFESANMSSAIKSQNGHFFMLNDLLSAITQEKARFHLGRNSQRGLAELKDLGDKSAHNRRFNATRADIDRLRADVRTAVEELLHLAGLADSSGPA